jgi:hypothetical protein
MYNCNKKITLILFICLLIAFTVIIIIWVYDKINTILDKKIYEHFKRSTRIKIYKNDKQFDPDEQPNINIYDPDNLPSKYDPE